MAKTTKNGLAARIARIFELMNPWDFYDAWESFAECVRCTRDELEIDPAAVLEALIDELEFFDEDDDQPVFHELTRAIADVRRLTSSAATL